MPPVYPSDGGKFLAYMSEVLARTAVGTVATTRLAAIVIPTVEGKGPTFLRGAARGETLRRIAPSTLLRGLRGGRPSFSHMAEMVRHLPCYELVLGASVEAVPDLLHELLDAPAR